MKILFNLQVLAPVLTINYHTRPFYLTRSKQTQGPLSFYIILLQISFNILFGNLVKPYLSVYVSHFFSALKNSYATEHWREGSGSTTINAGPTVNPLPLVKTPEWHRSLQSWAPSATLQPQHSAQHEHNLLMFGVVESTVCIAADVTCWDMFLSSRKPPLCRCCPRGMPSGALEVGGGAVTAGHILVVPAVGPVPTDPGLQVPVPRSEPVPRPIIFPALEQLLPT